MNDPTYADLIAAGYEPDQILGCEPCKCKESLAQVGRLAQDCTFPTHRGGVSIEEWRARRDSNSRPPGS